MGVSSKLRSICRFGSNNERVWVFLGFLSLLFLLKSFKDDLRVNCLVALLYEQLGDYEIGG